MKLSKYLALTVLLFWGLLFYPAIIDMVSVWSGSKTYEHGFLIVPIAIWLAWQNKEHFKFRNDDITLLPAILLLLPLILYLIGLAANVSLFTHAAAILSLQLIIWLLVGSSNTKLMWFPILYLWFCIPFGEELVPTLQIVTADQTIYFLRMFNIPVYRDGLYIYIPNGAFHVAEACSGIRFLISSIALGTLFAYQFFDSTLKRILFVIFACVTPVLANGVRAFGIVLIGHLSDMEHATGADHLVYGWFFFMIVILLILGAALLFSDNKSGKSSNSIFSANAIQSRYSLSSPLIALFLVSVTMFWQTYVLKTVANDQYIHSQKVLESLNYESPQWGIMYPNAVQYSLSGDISDGAQQFSATYQLAQETGELVSSLNKLYNNDIWNIRSIETLKLDESVHLNSMILNDIKGETLSVVYIMCIENFCSNDTLKLTFYSAYQRLVFGDGKAKIYAIASKNKDIQELSQRASQWLEEM